MSWFTENPWPVVVACVALGSIFLGMGLQGNRKRNWGIGLIFFLSAGMVYYVESIIVTEAEKVELAIHESVQACIDGDVEGVLEHVSVNNIVLQGVVRAGLALVDIHEDMHVTDLSVTMLAGDTRAKSHFRVNGTVSLNKLNHQGHAATRWNVTWQKEGGEWKIIEVDRLDPVTGQSMNILKQSSS